MQSFIKSIIDFFSNLFSRRTAPIEDKKEKVPPPVEPVVEPVIEPVKEKWHAPIRIDKFKLTQGFLNPDPINYPKTGHHPGVDYGTQGRDNIPLYYCADGEVIESGLNASCGNYFLYYVSSVDRTFVYFHLRDKAPAKGFYKGGQEAGITGQTGLSHGIHLHFECIKGRKTFVDRVNLYTSKDAILQSAEDADEFIRKRL